MAPTLPAISARHGACCVSVWCAYCQAWHTHGLAGRQPAPGESLGHYAAHCHRPDSPYQDGYELQYVGAYTPGVRTAPRCTATTKAGAPCPRAPMHGQTLCYGHHPAWRWRRKGYRHPEDYAIDCWVAGIERRIRARRRHSA
ncbi:MAG TPA: hypothetical protein VKV26_08920 [Dehalococcoidia bacterium]|nr:hypothetical protein [Dehalococcoidia bacterium]